MSKFVFSVRALLASLALVVYSGCAQAVVIHQTGISSGLNVNNLKLPLVSSAGTYFSGLQVLKIDGVSTLGFCIDPYQSSPASVTGNYAERTDFNTFFGTRASQINALYSRFYNDTLPGVVGANLNAAGFQLALWELVADNLDLGTGNVRMTAATTSNTPVRVNAQGMLGALNAGHGNDYFSFRIYTSSTRQDYLVATEVPAQRVPEPAAVLLLLSGLLALRVSQRR